MQNGAKAGIATAVPHYWKLTCASSSSDPYMQAFCGNFVLARNLALNYQNGNEFPVWNSNPVNLAPSFPNVAGLWQLIYIENGQAFGGFTGWAAIATGALDVATGKHDTLFFGVWSTTWWNQLASNVLTHQADFDAGNPPLDPPSSVSAEPFWP
jgi:hypothetical protein